VRSAMPAYFAAVAGKDWPAVRAVVQWWLAGGARSGLSLSLLERGGDSRVEQSDLWYTVHLKLGFTCK
jgi:hypothetical protein